MTLLVLVGVLLFHVWCHVYKFPTCGLQVLRVHNHRTTDIHFYAIGTIAVSPWKVPSWRIPPGELREFNVLPGDLHLSTGSQSWWSVFVILPGWTDYHVQEHTVGGISGITITPEAVLRNVHAWGLYPWYFVGVVNHHRRVIRRLILAGCLAALWRRDLRRGPPGRGPAERLAALACGCWPEVAPRGPAAAGVCHQGVATRHDALKALALGPMILDHVGRMVFQVDTNWWNAPSKFLSMPIYFFLTGGGAARQPPPASADHSLLRMLVAHFLLEWILYPDENSCVLLAHVVAALLFSAASDFSKWPLSRHCLVAACLVMLNGLVHVGLQIGSGTAGLLYAGAGFASLGRAPRSICRLWLAVATVLRASVIYHFEFESGLRKHGWAHVSGPAAVSLAMLPVQWWCLEAYRRGPLPVWTPGWLSALCRCTGRWALEVYVGHMVVLYFIAWSLGNIPEEYLM